MRLRHHTSRKSVLRRIMDLVYAANSAARLFALNLLLDVLSESGVLHNFRPYLCVLSSDLRILNPGITAATSTRKLCLKTAPLMAKVLLGDSLGVGSSMLLTLISFSM